jgi:hypothetical protein
LSGAIRTHILVRSSQNMLYRRDQVEVISWNETRALGSKTYV